MLNDLIFEVMATTKSANQGKENENAKRGSSSSGDNKSKGSMSSKTSKSDSKSHK